LGERPKDASLLDILAGDITFKSPKPQVLVFEDVRIAKFPKTKAFNSIKNKLKSGRSLTQSEANALLRFQLKPTGKFKPIGALSKEPEIVLAPGEIIKREKLVARVIIKGRPIPIIRARVIKAKSQTKKLLIKAKQGKLKTKELKTLRKNLKRETGFEPRLSRGKIGKRIVRARPLIRPRVRVRPRPHPRPKVRPKPRARPKPRKRIVRPVPRKRIVRPKPRKRIVRPVPRKRIVRPVPRKRIVRPIPRPSIKPIPTLKKRRRIKKKLVRPQSFEVWARPLKKTKKGKKRPKLIKISKVPLSKERAESLRNWLIDHSLSRTGKIKAIKPKPKKPKLKVPKSYSKKTKHKFRSHRIKAKKKIKLKKGRVIERSEKGRSYLLDTISEKRGITLRRKLAQLEKQSGFKPTKKKPRRKPVKRRTPKSKPVKRTTQRRPQQTKRKRSVSQAQLDALAKGRAKRMSNLRKRK